MAKITGRTDEQIFRIQRWKGLNENPDGDTKLEMGEAAAMRNFRVTRDGNLQKRPGLAQTVGVMQAYRLAEDVAVTEWTEDGACSRLTMYPSAAATETGFVEGTGTPAEVSFSNWSSHVGWYCRESTHRVWKLVSIAYDGEEDRYIWTVRVVRAAGVSENKRVTGLWAGNVAGQACMAAACDGKLWKVHDGNTWCKEALGSLDTTGRVHMFGFAEKLYILNGKKYYVWDGETFGEVEGYRPLIAVTVPPAGGGQLLEQVNKLCGARRVRLSPDGTAAAFQLPEKGLASVDYAKNLATGAAVSYTANLANGTVTFSSAPAAGVNSIEVGYSVAETDRARAEGMRFSELFNGANDNRVFLYGAGSNQALYSGLDYDGEARADYFPDLNVLVIGEANTPITACVRHYSRLMVYKTDSAYSVQYSVDSLADGSNVPAYYATPVNRVLGNAAPGQVRVVLNSPITLFGRDLYEWRNTTGAVTLTGDERQAARISDRITATLGSFDLGESFCWNDRDNQEYYLCQNGKTLVWSYAADAWYVYDGFTAVSMVNFMGGLYIGDELGRVCSFRYGDRADNGDMFSCYWESGSMAFNREWMRKYSAMVWIGLKPEPRSRLLVTAQTDRRSEYTEKAAGLSLATFFVSTDFKHWSFVLNRKPHMTRMKIKAKKFVYYKLIFRLENGQETCTVLNADIRVRYTGYARG